MHTHSKIGKLIWLAIVVLIIGGGFMLYKSGYVSLLNKEADIVNDEIPQVNARISLYENYLYKFKFEYPSNLYMKERELSEGSRSQLSILLVEGIKENIDIIEGKSTEVREGPTAITLDIYENSKKLTPADWVKQDPNWNIGDKQTSLITITGEQGVSYEWSGLYEGESIIIAKGNEIYVFSVTWMTDEDKILKDFDVLLKSFSFTE